ncbi:organic cation transporter protein-like [Euwallacea fornicatus]|uniref:organic cation transporter protein-like n=1 Tax=Euwallacea fornicatus TaxID=995702 RepID=UPI00338EF2E2
MGFDDILHVTGGFGRHQWKLFFLFSLPVHLNVFVKIGNVLIVSPPKYRCVLPFEPENPTYNLDDEVWHQWYYYDSYAQEYSACTYLVNDTEVKCDKFVFDTNLGRTLSVEFNLTCEKDYLIATSNSLGVLGFLLGSIFFGNMSDRYGRKRIFTVVNVAYLSLGFLAIFSPNIWTYLILKLLMGFITSGIYYTSYVLLIESTEPEKRVLATASLNAFYCSAMVLASVLGYLAPSWKYLDLFYTFFGIPCIFYIWLIPESPRWLISKQRISEAKKAIATIAKDNNVKVIEEHLQALVSGAAPDKEDFTKVTILDALKYPTLRKRIFIILYLNFSFMVYFAIVWNVSRLSGNLYINMALYGLMEIPSLFLTLIPGQKFGRRIVVSSFCVATGLCMLMSSLKRQGDLWVQVWLNIAKAIISSVLAMNYAYSSEIYPTVLRNAGLGMNSFMAGLGAVICPYIYYLHSLWENLPNMIYTSLIISSGLLCLLLPETLNKKLPETLEDAEAF